MIKAHPTRIGYQGEQEVGSVTLCAAPRYPRSPLAGLVDQAKARMMSVTVARVGPLGHGAGYYAVFVSQHKACRYCEDELGRTLPVRHDMAPAT
jgi:hypothetical protein